MIYPPPHTQLTPAKLIMFQIFVMKVLPCFHKHRSIQASLDTTSQSEERTRILRRFIDVVILFFSRSLWLISIIILFLLIINNCQGNIKKSIVKFSKQNLTPPLFLQRCKIFFVLLVTKYNNLILKGFQRNPFKALLILQHPIYQISTRLLQ